MTAHRTRATGAAFAPWHVAALLALTACAGSGAARAQQQPEPVWEATGFATPETVLHDPERGVLYVSNVAGAPTDKDGEGFIAKLGLDGRMVEPRWVTGLNAPKGMAIRDGLLYIADIDRLVAVDIEAGAVAGAWEAPDARFLNDVAVDEGGRVFVSDMLGSAIYALEGDSFGVWIQDDELSQPNGLLLEADRLVFAPWAERAEGFLKAATLDAKDIRSLGGDPEDQLDGLEPDGAGGYLVTDFNDGALYRFSGDGAAERLLDLDAGSANLEYLEGEGLAVIPMFMDDVVRAYRIE